ncbi:MAG TPA: hypothetical protein VFL90_03560 [Methylomirabilota bacterium]|nr:hypothetical protein [Methylomirabilota bacterium]
MLTDAFGASACLSLTDLLRRALAEDDRWREWATPHPLTPERASAASVLCTTLR